MMRYHSGHLGGLLAREEEEEGMEMGEEEEEVLPWEASAAFMFPFLEYRIPFDGWFTFFSQPYNLYELLGLKHSVK